MNTNQVNVSEYKQLSILEKMTDYRDYVFTGRVKIEGKRNRKYYQILYTYKKPNGLGEYPKIGQWWPEDQLSDKELEIARKYQINI